MNLDLQLFRELESAVIDQVQRLAAELVAGKALTYDDYRFRCGKIRGLEDALKLAREANARVVGLDDRKDR